MLADWRTAPVDDRLKAVLGFLEKVTLRPEEVTGQDAQRLLAAGVTEAAVVDALYVCFLFNIYDRVADSLKFRLHPQEEYTGMARSLLKRGYL